MARLATVTLGLVVAGGIIMAAGYGKSHSLIPSAVLAAVAVVVLAVNVLLLARIRPFAWTVFFRVLGAALAAYVVIAGILEFVFIYDHTPARQLILFTCLLVLFAVDVPLLLAFSVARYQPASLEEDP